MEFCLLVSPIPTQRPSLQKHLIQSFGNALCARQLKIEIEMELRGRETSHVSLKSTERIVLK